MRGVVIVCAVICSLTGNSRALSIRPCHSTDAACLQQSAQALLPVLAAGVPEFGIATMDPMHMERVATSQAGLDMDFRNTTVTGLKHCKVLNLTRDYPRTSLELKCSVNMVGDYTLGGQLLIMHIEGHGKYAIKIRDIIVKIQFLVGEKSVHGERYWTVKSWRHSSDVQRGVHFQFNNLFDGRNRELAQAVHRFANENWRDIFQEVAPPIVKAIVAQILAEITKLFDHVPIKDLVLQ